MLYEQVRANKQKTVFLMFFFSMIVLGAGWGIGYLFTERHDFGLGIALLILLIYLPIVYGTAAKQVLLMSGAREITKEQAPQLYNIVEELIIVARLPMPKIYIIDDPAPNAFATGIKPEKSAVAFTTGLLNKLNREELEGVVAHELAHIRNYDIRLMTLCVALVGVVVFLGQMGSRMFYYQTGRQSRRSQGQKTHPIFLLLAIVFVLFAPLATQFAKLAVSRNREYLADATAVEFTGNPEGLIKALQKISSDPNEVQRAQEATAAMYISQPLKKRRRSSSLWSTHPPIESRIERLRKM